MQYYAVHILFVWLQRPAQFCLRNLLWGSLSPFCGQEAILLLEQSPNTSSIQLGQINITKVAIRSIGHLWNDSRWPNVDEAAYANRRSRRACSVLEFVKSACLYVDIAVGALSAIHRGHFARVMESREEDSSSPRLGGALLAFTSRRAR